MAEVAAALLDASRKLTSEKDFRNSSSTGNVSVGSGSSWTSNNEVNHKNSVAMENYNYNIIKLSDKTPSSPTGPPTSHTSSWWTNSWGGGGERKR